MMKQGKQQRVIARVPRRDTERCLLLPRDIQRMLSSEILHRQGKKMTLQALGFSLASISFLAR